MTTREENLQWWRESKLGLFIHWGLYSLMGKGEWAMYTHRIPVKEYEKLAGEFQPVDFDARSWVRFAKENGMKYIVITAKHHDGFSMFRTEVSDYNIVDATPYGKDPMAELAQACREEGVKLGFYYSHVREWRHPKAASFEKKGRGDVYGNYGNFWDYPNENQKDLQEYMDDFNMPQLKELLTQYGDILTIWFDTPSQITPDQGRQLRKLVYDTQSGCLVNSRLSYEIETDYQTMADDAIPAAGLDLPWETPMTTHNGWGYVDNADYRSGEEIIRKIAEVAGKGGNLLINVGPDSKGVIPEGAKTEFAKVGEWLRVNGEGIYGTQVSGFPYKPNWGYVTRKGNCLYLLVLGKSKEKIALSGLESQVKQCVLLGKEEKLNYEQQEHCLTVDWNGSDDSVQVIRVECEQQLQIKSGIYAGEDGSIELAVQSAVLHRDYPYSHLEIQAGITELWTSEQDFLSWEFETEKTAEYEVKLIWDAKGFWGIEDLGHELKITVENQEGGMAQCEAQITEEFPEVEGIRYVSAGKITLSAGNYVLKLKPEHIVMQQLMGLRVRGMRLERTCD